MGLTTILLIHPKLRLSVSLAWLVYALSAPLFHLQMLLAESIITPALISTLLLFYSYWQFRRPSGITFLVFWTLSSWIAIWSTIVAIPPFVLILLGFLLATIHHWREINLSIIDLKERVKSKQTIRLLVILLLLFLTLHGLFVLYFWWHAALADAFWAIVQYNTQYYFPLRLAHSTAQAESGYFLAVLSTFIEQFQAQWNTFIAASTIAIQTAVGLTRQLVQSGYISIDELLIVWTEWYTKVATAQGLTTLLSSLILVYVAVRRQWFAIVWLVLFLIGLRGRDNELFKLGPYFLPIIGLGILTLTESIYQKNKIFSIFFSSLVIGWIILVIPSYFQAITKKESIFPTNEIATATRIVNELQSMNSTKKILFISGNPDYYLLTKKLPAFKYYYYHPWFHAVPSIQSEMTRALTENVEAIVVLESELSGTDLQYAETLENLVKSKYATVSGGIYVPIQ